MKILFKQDGFGHLSIYIRVLMLYDVRSVRYCALLLSFFVLILSISNIYFISSSSSLVALVVFCSSLFVSFDFGYFVFLFHSSVMIPIYWEITSLPQTLHSPSNLSSSILSPILGALLFFFFFPFKHMR